jgi:hypothetical protein
MSAAALEVRALKSWLERARERGSGLHERGAGRRLQRRVAREVELPWLLATTEDFRFPETTGRRPFGLGVLQWYIGHILELSATHPDILRRFMLVMNLLAGPLVLLTPKIIFTVLLHSLRGRPSAALGKTEPPLPCELEDADEPRRIDGGALSQRSQSG